MTVNHQVEEDLAHSLGEEIPHPPLRPYSSLAQDLDIIKAGCHLRKYVMIVEY
jgi:hypothetical protein